MRFERDRRGEELVRNLVTHEYKGEHYACKTGGWQYLVAWDSVTNKWSASYRRAVTSRTKKSTGQFLENPDTGKNSFPTRRDAEMACMRQHKINQGRTN